jgi:hypothetical protein
VRVGRGAAFRPASHSTARGADAVGAQAIEKVEPKYKPSQAALTAFFKLHEPSDENWKAPFAVLEVTDGCPLNGMYRRCVETPF